MEAFGKARDFGDLCGGFVILAVAVPMERMLDLVIAFAEILEDIYLRTGLPGVTERFTESRRLQPERRPVAELALEETTAEGVERRIEASR